MSMIICESCNIKFRYNVVTDYDIGVEEVSEWKNA